MAMPIRLIGGPRDGQDMVILYGNTIVIWEPAPISVGETVFSERKIRRGEYRISEDRRTAEWQGFTPVQAGDVR